MNIYIYDLPGIDVFFSGTKGKDKVVWLNRTYLSLFSSHRKNWFTARCEYLHIIKKNSQYMFSPHEFF